MQASLCRFIQRLRTRGLEISPGEHLDALAALQQLAWVDRLAFREALRATLVKRADHDAVFSAEFDRFFVPPPLPAGEKKGKRGGGSSTGHQLEGARATGRRQEGQGAGGDRPRHDRAAAGAAASPSTATARRARSGPYRSSPGRS